MSRADRTVTAREAAHCLPRLLAVVEDGGEVVIVDGGRPVAVLKAYREPPLHDAWQAAVDRGIARLTAEPDPNATSRTDP
ncbi:MAG: hypothetical protein HY985_12035 [Magnetospirillum sp.]|nr:hypothetical protein [Magnetospirillum sp.]